MRLWTCFFSVLAQLLLAPNSTKLTSTINSLEAETSKWTVLTYTQRFTDDEKEQVTYTGTLFLQLTSVSLSSCDLKLAVRVQDKYTGTTIGQKARSVKRTELAPKTQTFTYTYLLRLGDLQQLETAALQGRPAQFQARTGYACDGNSSCVIPWLDVKLPEARIKETRDADSFTDFDEMVKEIDIPMSSRQAAQEAATQLTALASECRTGHS